MTRRSTSTAFALWLLAWSACNTLLFLPTSVSAESSTPGSVPPPPPGTTKQVRKVVKRVVKKVPAPSQTQQQAQAPPPVELYLASNVSQSKEAKQAPPPAANKNLLVLSEAQGTLWARVLSFHAGFTNALFLSALLSSGIPKQVVTACTGAWTNSALGAVTGQAKVFYSQAAIILSYIVGSMIYGLIVPNPKPWTLERRKVSTSLQLMGACFAGAYFLVQGPQQDPFLTQVEHVASFCLCALAFGMQNSMTSVHSANLCRTTHYSGMTSDMGTFLGQCLRGNFANLPKLKTFAKLSAAFWTGGAVAIFAAQQTGSAAKCLWVSAAVPLFLSMAV